MEHFDHTILRLAPNFDMVPVMAYRQNCVTLPRVANGHGQWSPNGFLWICMPSPLLSIGSVLTDLGLFNIPFGQFGSVLGLVFFSKMFVFIPNWAYHGW